jgi:dipeptidyl aminopeptidase/acylaminoacyl peptidase
VLIVHGTRDATVPVEQSRLMAEALKKAGVESQLILVEGAPHSFHLEPKEKDLRPAVIGFFDKHLKSR